MAEDLVVLGNSGGALEGVDVYAWKRPAAGKGLNVLAKGVDVLFALAFARSTLKVLNSASLINTCRFK